MTRKSTRKECCRELPDGARPVSYTHLDVYKRQIYQRITALGSMCISVCYTSVLEGKPDNIDNMKPILYDIIRRAL